MSTLDDEHQLFLVVINDQGQYSIWPDFKPVPTGWRETGVRGPRKECLAHIAEVWTDMRPLPPQDQPNEGST